MGGDFITLPHLQNSIWTYICGWKPSPILIMASLLSGISILFLCILCSLSIESYSRHKNLLLVIRGLLAILATALFIDAVMVPHDTQSRHTETAAVTVGSYGIFKTWEICIAPLFDGAHLPSWVPLSNLKAKINGSLRNGSDGRKDGVKENGAVLSKRMSRTMYSLDFLTTLRGVSWFPDRRFDFLAPVYVQKQNQTPARGQFLRDRLPHFIFVNLAYDILDTFNRSILWTEMTDLVEKDRIGVTALDPEYAHQITTRPLYQQAAFVFSVAVTTQLSFEVLHTLLALICVGIFKISTSAFPPLYNNPFSLRTNSVRSFWGERWHHIFRRVFDRAIDPGMHVLRINKRSNFGRAYRVVAIFLLSCFLHCLLQARIQMYHFPPGYAPPLFDHDTLSFFLSQPLAMAFEHFILHPILLLLPPSVRWVVCRIWTWGWLFWSGRWWTDSWVKMGMWCGEPRFKPYWLAPFKELQKGMVN